MSMGMAGVAGKKSLARLLACLPLTASKMSKGNSGGSFNSVTKARVEAGSDKGTSRPPHLCHRDANAMGQDLVR